MTVREFSVVSGGEGALGEDGIWTVEAFIKEGRKVGGGEWEYVEVRAKAMDRKFPDAYGVALNSVIGQANEIYKKNGIPTLFESGDKQDKKE